MANIEQLIKDLQSDNSKLQFKALKELGKAPSLSKEAIEAVKQTTQDNDIIIANEALHVLAIHQVESKPSHVDKPPDTNNFLQAKDVPSIVPKTRPKYPWFKIWIKPRGTIREIINYDTGYLTIPLALISGFAQALDRSIGRSAGDNIDLIILIPLIMILGPIAGLFALFVGGAILSWVGGLLGGEGSREEVMTALAWSSIPQILVIVLDLGLIAILGGEAFTSITPQFDARIQQDLFAALFYSLILIGIMITAIVISVWSIILYIKCIAEAHRFSVWRSIATILIPSAVVIGVALICLIPILISL